MYRSCRKMYVYYALDVLAISLATTGGAYV
jgi:hypothetical protein